MDSSETFAMYQEWTAYAATGLMHFKNRKVVSEIYS